MVEIISWSETPDKDKVRLLLDKVLGYFVLEETAKGYHTPDLSKYAQNPTGFHWPIAFWNTDGECWVYKDIADNNVTFFDPLHDLNATWLLMQKADGMSVTVSYSPYAQTDTIRMAHHTCEITYWDPYTSQTYRACAETAQEAICIAFLRKAGIQVVEVLKEALSAWRLTWEDGQQMMFKDRDWAEKEYNERMKYLKDNLRWAKDSRKVKLEEIKVPEDYFNGGIEWA